MEKFYTKEKFIRYSEQQNLNRLNAIKAIECLNNTIHQFDGKVYNVKFTKALNERLMIEHLDETYFSIENYGCYFYVRDADSFKENPNAEYSAWCYVDYTYYMPKLFDIGKRISFENLLPLLIARKEEINASIENTINELLNIDAIEEEYHKLKKQVDDFNSGISYNLQSLFKI